MGKESSHTQTLSGLWRNDLHNAYWVIIPGDLVSVGPVHYKRLGIALEIKHVSFGAEPDEWDIFIDGKIERHSTVYIVPTENKIPKDNYDYIFMTYSGGKND